MRIIHTASELQPAERGVCLAIGFFDGVHLGHQQILRQTINGARQHEGQAVALTFDRHPNTVVAPEHVPPLIYALPQRLRAIVALEIETLLLIHFDKAFSEKTAETFVQELSRELHPLRSICVGSNFFFGRRRAGNVELLKKMGRELNFAVHALAAVALDGQPVSSTRIREAIIAGDLDEASQMMGRAYSLTGQVIQGDGVGRQLGFPTANLEVTGLALPPKGVYAAHATTHGKIYRAALNIGLRPTLRTAQPRLHVEAHLLDFEGDLYGTELEITFGQKLREEKKFASTTELKEQIARDIQTVRHCFNQR